MANFGEHGVLKKIEWFVSLAGLHKKDAAHLHANYLI
jgi:hypothetical protein